MAQLEIATHDLLHSDWRTGLPSIAGNRVALLRAYDKDTGEDVGAVNMPAKQTGSPMSYMINGKQFIVVAVSGVDGGELLAYALP